MKLYLFIILTAGMLLFREDLSGNIYPVYYSKPFPNGEFGCVALPPNGKECVVTPRVGSIAKAYR